MEYSQTKYFLFKINEYLNSYNFMIVFFILIFLLSSLFFLYNYFNEEQFNFKRMRKVMYFHNIEIGVILLIFVIMLFGILGRNYKIDNPNKIVRSNKEQIVATGKVVDINSFNSNITVEINYKNKVFKQVALPYSHEAELMSKELVQFDGLSVKKAMDFSVNDSVNICFRPYKYKYLNREKFEDKNYNRQLEKINSKKINSEIEIKNK